MFTSTIIPLLAILGLAQGVVVTTNVPIMTTGVIVNNQQPSSTAEPTTPKADVTTTAEGDGSDSGTPGSASDVMKFLRMESMKTVVIYPDCFKVDDALSVEITTENNCTQASLELQQELKKTCSSSVSSCFTTKCVEFFKPSNPLIQKAIAACTAEKEFTRVLEKVYECTMETGLLENFNTNIVYLMKNLRGHTVEGIKTTLLYTHKHCLVSEKLDDSLMPDAELLLKYKKYLAASEIKDCNNTKEEKNRREEKAQTGGQLGDKLKENFGIQVEGNLGLVESEAKPRPVEDQLHTQWLWSFQDKGNSGLESSSNVQFNLGIFECDTLCESAKAVVDKQVCCNCLKTLGDDGLVGDACLALKDPLNDFLDDLSQDEIKALAPHLPDKLTLQTTYMGLQGFDTDLNDFAANYCSELMEHHSHIHALFSAKKEESSTTAADITNSDGSDVVTTTGTDSEDEEGSSATVPYAMPLLSVLALIAALL